MSVRLIMCHPSGTVMHHNGGLISRIRDWRMWLWAYRNGYRFGWLR